MSNSIYILPNCRALDTYFVFSITPNCFQQVSEYLDSINVNCSIPQFLSECFSQNHYLMTLYTSKTSGYDGLNIYVNGCVFSCNNHEDSHTLLLYGFRKEASYDVANSIHKGVNLFARGTLLNITINHPLPIKAHYLNGYDIEYSKTQDYACDIEAIFTSISLTRDDLKQQRSDLMALKYSKDTIEEPTISEEFENYLSIAETYAQFEDEIAYSTTACTQALNCSNPQAAHDYQRQDRVAYTYQINGDYDALVYKVNTKVDVEVSEDKVLGATIIALNNEQQPHTVTLLFDDIISFSQLPQLVNCRLTYSKAMYEVQQGVIDQLRDSSTRATFLDNVLGKFEPEKYEMMDLSKLEYTLNHPPVGQFPPTDSQMDAIKRGISCKDIMLVQGPPGTGKTTVILEWVKYFCKEKHQRVLISSQNNKAVDNVLERLAQEEGIEAIRAGNEAKIQKNLYPLLLENKIANLRDKISKSTDTNINEADRLISFIENSLLHPFELLNDTQKLCAGQKARYDSLYRKNTNEFTSFLKDYPVSCRNLVNQMDALIPQIVQHVEKRRNAKFFKFLYNAKIDQLLDAYQQLEKQYNEYQRKYQQLLNIALRNMCACQLMQASMLIKQTQATLNQLSEAVKTIHWIDSPLWDKEVYNQVKNFDNVSQVSVKYELLKQEVKRLKGIKELLTNWKDTIENQNNYALSDALLESVNLVGATCIGINSQKKFANLTFDVTIIDEAGQIQIHNALVPMSRSPKLIMLGDHKQIPPVENSEVVKRCEEEGLDAHLQKISLFEELFEHLPDSNKALLDTQFRMPGEIADILSEWFYESKYLSFKGKRNMKSIFPDLFASPFVLIDTGDLKNHGETKLDKGYINKCEIKLVDQLMRKIVDFDNANAIKPEKIGVISPYGDQVKELVNTLSKIECIGTNASEVAATLDSFQGQERDLIIYSSTRSNTRDVNDSGRIGFLKELRRLNVALSRPKKMLIFIGDLNFLCSCTNDIGPSSAKEFSEFMQLMVKRVKEGYGQLLSGKELIGKLEDSHHG